jgi:hypothetical protein
MNPSFAFSPHYHHMKRLWCISGQALIDDRRIKVDFSQSVSKLWNQYRRGDRSMVQKSDSGNGNPNNITTCFNFLYSTLCVFEICE